MSRRRPATPAVTLFPFLAVLVCTMGALILLLLVTTRRIRLQAEEVVAHAAVQPADAGDLPLLPLLAEEPKTDPEEERRKRLEEYGLARQAREREQQRLDSEWQARLASATQEHERTSARFAALQSQVRADAEDLERLRSDVARAAEMLAGGERQQQELAAMERKLSEQVAALARQATVETLRIETTRNENRTRTAQLEIVAFDPSTGTERQPILIECRTDRLVFAAEGVPVSALELTGFTPDHNPLKAGSEALVEYWSAVEGRRRSGKKPYVLLVIRPGGTVGFYVARKMLENMDHDFGYELVHADDDIRWPETDPEAARVCREAVERVLNERERLAGQIRGGRYPIAGSLMFAGADGRFQLREVEELRNTDDDSLYIGGQRWSPPRRPAPAPAPATATAPATAAGGTPETAPPTTPEAQRTPGTVPERSTAPGKTGGALAERIAEEWARQGLHGADPVSPQQEGERSLDPAERTQQGERERETGRWEEHDAPRHPLASSAPRRLKPSPDAADEGNGSFSPRPPFSTRRAEETGKRSRWDRPGMIGLEREVTIRVWEDRATIDDDTEIQIPPSLAKESLQGAVAGSLQAHVQSWGVAPEAFFWKPSLKIVVHPGGNQHCSRIGELADEWGLRKRVEYGFD